ncbi:MAG: hypothetical protein EO766_11905 [Hydrotalea sp. AMD]|uniref:hypothetical protein n=1 Tax=Hydrotalea sp. AMD TaxID=2501297 RepID=UPI001025AA66|nr:hypothetical protein [Hydrotalea sp. AMD]RWZ87223.1 MAG: hypothetical protein EO766_11905 [Hydrotalea sp. AMD]
MAVCIGIRCDQINSVQPAGARSIDIIIEAEVDNILHDIDDVIKSYGVSAVLDSIGQDVVEKYFDLVPAE